MWGFDGSSAGPPRVDPSGTAARPLRVLFVDDSAEDAEREAQLIGVAGFDVSWRRVDSAEELRTAATEAWDLLVAENRLCRLSAAQALEIWRAARRHGPALVVARDAGEDAAVGALKAGADDFVSKARLGRLGPAVASELHEAELRTERARARRAERLLARASASLAQTLDLATTVELVAKLGVPMLADVAALDLACLDGALERVAVAAEEGTALAVVEAVRCQHLPPGEPYGPAHVVAAGQAEVLPSVADGPLPACGQLQELLRITGARSYMCVPLRARGQTLGALSLLATRSERTFAPTDLALAEELAERAALAVDNARLYRSAREAIRARDEFLSVAAHELRTPLTTLQLQIQSLLASLRRRGDGAPIEPRDSQKVERAVRGVERLTALVNSLVDVSRLVGGGLDLARERVDLGELMRDLVDRFADDARRAGCELRLLEHQPAVGEWDRVRLEQVLSNLLSNAIKYGPGKPIEVVVRGHDGLAELAVRDQGMGIAADDIERIFERFERAVSTCHYGGLGLGLYVARQIVEAHGGRLRVDSAPGAGATFVLCLPTGDSTTRRA